MVVFTNGEKDAQNYRRFKISSDIVGPNDFASMEEVLTRRLKHTEWDFPDLIIVDGGKGQVTSGLKALEKYKLLYSSNEVKYRPVPDEVRSSTLSLSKGSRPWQGGQARTIKSQIFYIDQNLKEKFPSVSVGIAIIKGVNIKKSNSDLEKDKEGLLKSVESLTTEELGKYPEIQSYRKLYKETGIDWHSRRPSPEALLRRVALNKGLYTINTCVDAYNLIVMKHRVSIGAFDLDKIEFPTILRFAKKDEEILLLGDNESTKYKDGEVAYFDKKGGYNIDFNYRDAQRTAVQLNTKNLYINVDGVYNITPDQVKKSLQEACDAIIRYCGGKVELSILIVD
jgi:DNA/RNA-binding domain of Phe-tRNA-synthetase-like protein